jgi:hypothetical protein
VRILHWQFEDDLTTGTSFRRTFLGLRVAPYKKFEVGGLRLEEESSSQELRPAKLP